MSNLNKIMLISTPPWLMENAYILMLEAFKMLTRHYTLTEHSRIYQQLFNAHLRVSQSATVKLILRFAKN